VLEKNYEIKQNNDILDIIHQADNAIMALIDAMKALAGQNVAGIEQVNLYLPGMQLDLPSARLTCHCQAH
jgi:hypothetical protein